MVLDLCEPLSSAMVLSMYGYAFRIRRCVYYGRPNLKKAALCVDLHRRKHDVRAMPWAIKGTAA
jgi:hypothetical protein